MTSTRPPVPETPPGVDQVREALRSVAVAGQGGDHGGDHGGGETNIVAAGLVESLTVSPSGVARITLKTDGFAEAAARGLADAAGAAADRVPGLARAVVIASSLRPQTAPQGSGGMGGGAGAAGGHANPLGLGQKGSGQKKGRIAAAAEGLKNVRHVLAVASGKGGVGKSSVAVNLAVAFARRGLKTGLLDADIYGPSLPTMLGLKGVKPKLVDGRLEPLRAHGLETMSIGYLVDEERALAWRGPMVMGAVRQIVNDVNWPALDMLVVDTPPGTGDAHLTLAQMKRLDGAVIVSTPQELALADVRRGVEFFRKVNIPVLGVIENMAYLETDGGGRTHLFGEGGARAAAGALDAPFLGEIPILPEIRIGADEGAPPTANGEAENDGAGGGRAAALFDALANDVLDRLAQTADG